jgi:hypothetical protein
MLADVRLARRAETGKTAVPPRVTTRRSRATALWYRRDATYTGAYSTANLPLIPQQSCHLFHTKVAPDSTANLPSIPGERCP